MLIYVVPQPLRFQLFIPLSVLSMAIVVPIYFKIHPIKAAKLESQQIQTNFNLLPQSVRTFYLVF